jgi:TRAP-type mannitol/chloroaromatic compound transport system permease small subunit
MHIFDGIIKIVDAITAWLGRLSWLIVVPLMAVLVYEVMARKLFISPTIWAMDSSYMLNGVFGMIGAVYALYRGGHICIDFISSRWSLRTQATMNSIYYITCFFPGMSIFLWFACGFAYDSWLQNERAITSAWMPPIYPLKMMMACAIALLLLQGISEFLKNLKILLQGEHP